jgi:hypothetical protein
MIHNQKGTPLDDIEDLLNSSKRCISDEGGDFHQRPINKSAGNKGEESGRNL